MALPDKRVQMGFVCGRDTVIPTTHRAMKLDTHSFTGKRVFYLSTPYSRLKSYTVEFAGTFDLDAQMTLCIKSAWYKKECGEGLSIDFAGNRSDIIAIQKFISAQVVGVADVSSAISREILPESPEGIVGECLSWIGDDYEAIPQGGSGREVAERSADSA